MCLDNTLCRPFKNKITRESWQRFLFRCFSLWVLFMILYLPVSLDPALSRSLHWAFDFVCETQTEISWHLEWRFNTGVMLSEGQRFHSPQLSSAPLLQREWRERSFPPPTSPFFSLPLFSCYLSSASFTASVWPCSLLFSSLFSLWQGCSVKIDSPSEKLIFFFSSFHHRK